MSDVGKIMMYNLELSRELYSELERRKFYVGYEEARADLAEAEELLSSHRRRKPTPFWKFWQRQDPEWRQQHAVLKSNFHNEFERTRRMANEYPLLADLYRFKKRPLRETR